MSDTWYKDPPEPLPPYVDEWGNEITADGPEWMARYDRPDETPSERLDRQSFEEWIYDDLRQTWDRALDDLANRKGWVWSLIGGDDDDA